jgi:hypothetical protein
MKCARYRNGRTSGAGGGQACMGVHTCCHRLASMFHGRRGHQCPIDGWLDLPGNSSPETFAVASMSGTSLSAVVLCLLLAPPSGAAPQDQRALMPPELRGPACERSLR